MQLVTASVIGFGRIIKRVNIYIYIYLELFCSNTMLLEVHRFYRQKKEEWAETTPSFL